LAFFRCWFRVQVRLEPPRRLGRSQARSRTSSHSPLVPANRTRVEVGTCTPRSRLDRGILMPPLFIRRLRHPGRLGASATCYETDRDRLFGDTSGACFGAGRNGARGTISVAMGGSLRVGLETLARSRMLRAPPRCRRTRIVERLGLEVASPARARAAATSLLIRALTDPQRQEGARRGCGGGLEAPLNAGCTAPWRHDSRPSAPA
jgi:hypothetical protein